MKAIVLGRISALVLTVIMTGLLMMAATGCGVQEKPSDTIEEFYILLSERKFSEAYNLLASDSKTKKAMSEEVFVQSTDKQTPQGLALTSFSVISESEDGDRAKVKFSVTFEEPGKEPRSNEVEAELVKEDGRWKIVL